MNNLTLGLAVVAGCTVGAIGGLVSDPVMRAHPEADWRSRLPAVDASTQPRLSAAALNYAGPTWWQYGNRRYTAESRWYGAEPAYIPAPLAQVAYEPALDNAAYADAALEPTVMPEPRLAERQEAQRAVAAALAATASVEADDEAYGDQSESAYADEDQAVIVQTAGI